MRITRFIATLSVAFAAWTSAFGQCTAENTAFNAGEELNYDLFFNWKFVWVSAGTATMEISKASWEGKPAYKAHLITRTSSKLDRFFQMRDTMQCVVTEDMVPRYFRKGANEVKRRQWHGRICGKGAGRRICGSRGTLYGGLSNYRRK